MLFEAVLAAVSLGTSFCDGIPGKLRAQIHEESHVIRQELQ